MRFRDRRLLSLLLVALASVAALALSACGGGDDSGDAKALLRDGFKKPIPRANLSVDLQIKTEGGPSADQPVNVKVSGPYDFSNVQSPKADWDVSLSGRGQQLTAGLIATGDNAFVALQGRNYEVGAEAFKQQIQLLPAALTQARSGLQKAKLDPGSWIKDPKEEGDEDVAGAETTKVAGDVDVLKMLTDIGKASDGTAQAPTQQQIDQFKQAVKDPKMEVFVAKDDKTIRRATTTLNFTVPQEQQAQAQGVTGGSMTLTVQFANVGQPVNVTAPTDARPLSELTKQAEGLGALGGAGGSGSGGSGDSGGSGGSGDSGGGSPPSQDAFRKYSDCLTKAGGDSAKVQECAKLLR